MSYFDRSEQNLSSLNNTIPSLETPHCKKFTRFLDFFYQTFLGLEQGRLFPASESLVSNIPAVNGNLNILSRNTHLEAIPLPIEQRHNPLSNATNAPLKKGNMAYRNE